MDGAFAPWHIIVLLAVLVVLFGAKRLPGAAKSLGESMHIFKKSVAGLSHEDEYQNGGSGSGFTANASAQPIAPPQPQQDAVHTQLQDLQSQVAELQRQGPSGTGGQPSQPA